MKFLRHRLAVMTVFSTALSELEKFYFKKPGDEIKGFLHSENFQKHHIIYSYKFQLGPPNYT